MVDSGADLLGNREAGPTAILRTCRENIAYNTLPYKFARMLPLHLYGLLRSGQIVLRRIDGRDELPKPKTQLKAA